MREGGAGSSGGLGWREGNGKKTESLHKKDQKVNSRKKMHKEKRKEQ